MDKSKERIEKAKEKWKDFHSTERYQEAVLAYLDSIDAHLENIESQLSSQFSYQKIDAVSRGRL